VAPWVVVGSRSPTRGDRHVMSSRRSWVGGVSDRTHVGQLELRWTDKDKALLSVGDGNFDYTFVDPPTGASPPSGVFMKLTGIEVSAPAEQSEARRATTDNGHREAGPMPRGLDR
jgi:hypothetical protein